MLLRTTEYMIKIQKPQGFCLYVDIFEIGTGGVYTKCYTFSEKIAIHFFAVKQLKLLCEKNIILQYVTWIHGRR